MILLLLVLLCILYLNKCSKQVLRLPVLYIYIYIYRIQAKAAAQPKRRKTPKKKGRKPKKQVLEDEVVYHYISYVHVGGFLWELDGMNMVPIKHARCTEENWLDVLRPIVRAKMQ